MHYERLEMRSNDKAILNAIEYLDGLGERTYFYGGMDAVNKLNNIMAGLRESLKDVAPCKCIHPHICDFNDRCCKNG